MRNVFILPLCAIIIQCSPSAGTKEGIVVNENPDTVAVKSESLLLADESSDKQLAVERDTSDLNQVYDEKRESTLNMTDVYYRVSISNNQYEATSEVTWYFDGDFSPRYFSLAWSAEGNEGTTELIIEDGSVVCGTKQEYNTTEKWCNDTGGTSMNWEETADAPTLALLPIRYGNTLDDELRENMDILKRILNESEAIEEDENLFTIKKEVEVNYGTDFTETLEVTIPKELYNYLKGM